MYNTKKSYFIANIINTKDQLQLLKCRYNNRRTYFSLMNYLIPLMEKCLTRILNSNI